MNPKTSTYCPKYPRDSGMKMPVFGVFEGVNYPFGYQSSIKDNELCGDGNAYSTYFRELDVRILRWWSNDPEKAQSPWESPYLTMGNNPIWFNDIFGNSVNPDRKKGKNFVIVPNRKLRKEDREEGTEEAIALGKKGLSAKLYGLTHSAYTGDYIKWITKSILSFGKLNIIQSDNPADAFEKVKNRLGKHGFVKNMTIDFHRNKFGSSDFSKSQEFFQDLNGGYAGAESFVYLAGCWMGGNIDMHTKNYTEEVSKWLDGATVYSNQAAASTPDFMKKSTFIGIPNVDYAKRPENTYYLGKHTVSTGYRSEGTFYIFTITITNYITIRNNGEIHLK